LPAEFIIFLIQGATREGDLFEMRLFWTGLIFLNLVLTSCGLGPIVRSHGEIPQSQRWQQSEKGQGAAAKPSYEASANAEQLWKQAQSALSRGETDLAEEKYRAYLKTAPWGSHAPDALMHLADISAKQGRVSTAASMYRQVVERFPDFEHLTEARLALMKSLLALKRYDEVLLVGPDPANAEDVSSRDPQEFVLLGDALGAIGDFPATARAYATAAKKVPSGPSSQIISDKLLAALEKMEPKDILNLVDRFETDPPRGDLLYALGVAYRHMGDNADADAVFNTFLDLYPHHALAGKVRSEVSVNSQEPLKETLAVGVLLPLTGRMERFGHLALKGIEIALSRFNEKNPSTQVELLVQDTTSDAEKTRRGMAELGSGRVLAVIGPLNTAEAAADEAQHIRVPIITLTQKEGIAETGDYVFRNFFSPKQQVELLAGHVIQKMGLRRLAVLYPDENYGTTFMKLFGEQVSQLGGEIVQTVPYDVSAKDFSAPIRKLAAARFDALFIPDGPAKVGLILPQLVYYDIRNIPLLGTNLWHDEKLIEMAGQYTAEAIIPDGFFAESQNPMIREFTESFTLAYGETPSFLSAVAYDSTMMILRLIHSGASTREAIQQGLLRLGNYEGVTGTTRFNPQGDAIKSLVLLKIEGSRFVELTSP
jgi:branched-chain amino acid transport system substrate-binding protein